MKKLSLILVTTLFFLSCKKEKGFVSFSGKLENNKDSFSASPINLQLAIADCIGDGGNNYGVMLFGDSMLNFPSSHIMSAVSSLTNTYNGLGNCYYPSKTDLVNNKGGFLSANNGGQLLDVNQQNSLLSQPEWAGRIGYINGSGQNVTFVTGGVF
ncbi:MAG: hypothetical protein ACWIPI_09705, partial [Polaribacter sp.]